MEFGVMPIKHDRGIDFDLRMVKRDMDSGLCGHNTPSPCLVPWDLVGGLFWFHIILFFSKL